ncbi:MAG: response regulator transcription factor [Bacteroidales bacterium]|nr:response regulator transcription factor [Bacteroidales bacterium]
MKVFLVDDQADCLETMRLHLKSHPDVEIVGEASSVADALAHIPAAKPDLLLLDVELPDGTGFDILRQLPHPLRTVFVTAFDRFAITAFRFSAVDYLLKPLDPLALADALDKVRKSTHRVDVNQQVEALLHNVTANEQRLLVLRTAEEVSLVPVADIVRLESDGAYTHVFVAGGRKILVSNNLKYYEEMLSDSGFMRCHQSHLVNIRQIDCFKKADGGYLKMRDGASVPVSTRRREALLQLFGSMMG